MLTPEQQKFWTGENEDKNWFVLSDEYVVGPFLTEGYAREIQNEWKRRWRTSDIDCEQLDDITILALKLNGSILVTPDKFDTIRLAPTAKQLKKQIERLYKRLEQGKKIAFLSFAADRLDQRGLFRIANRIDATIIG